MEATASHPYSIGSTNDGMAALNAQVIGIVDVNGNPISGVQFTPAETPEPAQLTGLGMIMLMLTSPLLKQRVH